MPLLVLAGSAALIMLDAFLCNRLYYWLRKSLSYGTSRGVAMTAYLVLAGALVLAFTRILPLVCG